MLTLVNEYDKKSSILHLDVTEHLDPDSKPDIEDKMLGIRLCNTVLLLCLGFCFMDYRKEEAGRSEYSINHNCVR